MMITSLVTLIILGWSTSNVFRSNVRIVSSFSSNRSLLPLTLWTVHSERPDDVNLSCCMVNETWFCTDDVTLYSLYDSDDSY
jgi:hypothetical protein